MFFVQKLFPRNIDFCNPDQSRKIFLTTSMTCSLSKNYFPEIKSFTTPDQGHNPPTRWTYYFLYQEYISSFSIAKYYILLSWAPLCPWNLSKTSKSRKALEKLENIRCQFLCWWRSLIGCVITDNGWALQDKTPWGCQDPDQRHLMTPHCHTTLWC